MKVSEAENKGTKPYGDKGCPEGIRVERGRIPEAPIDREITENNTNTDRSKYGMFEEILTPGNLNKAFKKVPLK